jgi:hypothetical protein
LLQVLAFAVEDRQSAPWIILHFFTSKYFCTFRERAASIRAGVQCFKANVASDRARNTAGAIACEAYPLSFCSFIPPIVTQNVSDNPAALHVGMHVAAVDCTAQTNG